MVYNPYCSFDTMAIDTMAKYEIYIGAYDNMCKILPG